MKNKSRKLNKLTVVDKYVATVFGDELMKDIAGAMGYDALDMQIGNVVSRLNDLSETSLIEDINEAMDEHNARSIPKPGFLKEDFWGNAI